MSQINVIFAPMMGRTMCTTKTVYQYNQGMILKLLGIDLPQAYTVDFANSVSGQSISQVGGADGVSIPDQFFVPGSTIYAWVVLTGTGYAVTRYQIMIPISPRAVRTNEEPTPSQQSALDEAIAALNDAVDAAETAITHYPKVEGGYWMVWDVTAGEYVSTGVQAQGPQGDPGVSPSASVEQTVSGATITVTDGSGTTTADLTNGSDGVSPAVTISTITGGHSVTITDANHPSGQSFDVMDGQDGSPGADGVGVPAGGTAGQILRKTSGTDYATEWAEQNPVVNVSGSTPSITAMAGITYKCGEVATLAITLPASGDVEVLFASGSTPTVLTVTPTKSGVTDIEWADGFDPDNLEANATYYLKFIDGEYGVATAWGVGSNKTLLAEYTVPSTGVVWMAIQSIDYSTGIITVDDASVLPDSAVSKYDSKVAILYKNGFANLKTLPQELIGGTYGITKLSNTTVKIAGVESCTETANINLSGWYILYNPNGSENITISGLEMKNHLLIEFYSRYCALASGFSLNLIHGNTEYSQDADISRPKFGGTIYETFSSRYLPVTNGSASNQIKGCGLPIRYTLDIVRHGDVCICEGKAWYAVAENKTSLPLYVNDIVSMLIFDKGLTKIREGGGGGHIPVIPGASLKVWEIKD